MSLWSRTIQPLLDWPKVLEYSAPPPETVRSAPAPELPLRDIPADLNIRPTTVAEAIERAEDWVNRPCEYRLGGGAPVSKPTPFSLDGTCDCSGFTCHTTGHNRIRHIDGQRVSYYTDNIVRDVWHHQHPYEMRGAIAGPGPRHLFTDPDGDEVLGAMLITKGKYLAGRRVLIGHARLVVKVLDGFRRGCREPGKEWWRFLIVVDCSPHRHRHGVEYAVKRHVAARSRRSSVATRGYLCMPRWYVG